MKRAAYNDEEFHEDNSKRVKADKTTGEAYDNTTPRKVLHLRGLQDDMEAVDVVQLAIPFGKVVNMVFAKKTKQVLLEMADLDAAISMVNYYKEKPAQFGRKTVYIQYSKYDELDTDLSKQHTNVIKAIEAGNEVLENSEKVSPVLRVVVTNMLHPVTIQAIKTIFSKYGNVQKIVTFKKNDTFNALIQMCNPIAAQSAKNFLNGKNIYNKCCTLRIDFSKMDSLIVKYNNEKTQDYTNPDLPSGPDMDHRGNNYDSHDNYGNSGGNGLLGDPMQIQGLLDNNNDQPISLLNSNFAPPPHHQTTQGLVGGGGGAGNHLMALQMSLARELEQLKMQGLLPSLGNSLGNLANLANLSGVLGGTMGQMANRDMGNSNGAPISLMAGLMDNHNNRQSRDMDRNGRGGESYNKSSRSLSMGRGGGQSRKVVLASNFNDSMVTNTDQLFILFGLYGNITKVKIMFNKKDSALIEYQEESQALAAVENLHKVKWFDKIMNVSLSKHGSVQMPKTGIEEHWLTKDYSDSKLNRFRTHNSKNHHNIYAPSPTLHLSNIPEGTTEEELRSIFEDRWLVEKFKFSPNDHKIAWIKMESTEIAIEALVATHNHQLSPTHRLRVSFTKFNL